QRNAFLVDVVGKRSRRGLGGTGRRGPVARAVDKQQGGTLTAVFDRPPVSAYAFAGIGIDDRAEFGATWRRRCREDDAGHDRSALAGLRIDCMAIRVAYDRAEPGTGAAGCGKPSVRQRATSSMPGPLSRASISKPEPSAS